MKHEDEIFSKVIELRKGMGVDELERANTEIDTLQNKLFAVAENYPELRSSDVVVTLESGITNAEEDLQASRRIYNKNVNAYNTAIAMFPASLLAMSRSKEELYTADEEKKKDIDINLL